MQHLQPAAPVAVRWLAPRGILTVLITNQHLMETMIELVAQRTQYSAWLPTSKFLHNQTFQEERLMPGARQPTMPCLQHLAARAATR